MKTSEWLVADRQGGDVRNLVDCRSDESEVEALLAADVTIEHHAEGAGIYVYRRHALRTAAFVDGFDRLAPVESCRNA